MYASADVGTSPAAGGANSCCRAWFADTICGMRLVNRTAVSVTGKQPYIDWTRKHDADANKGMLTVARVKPYGTAILLPEFEVEENVQEWIEENASWLFELQLAEWT